jgi:hypothetical protein
MGIFKSTKSNKQDMTILKGLFRSCRKISPKDLNMDNPVQAKRSSGQNGITPVPNSEGVELLRSSGDRRNILLPRAAFAPLSCKGLSIWKSFGLLCPDFLKLTAQGNALWDDSNCCSPVLPFTLQKISYEL